MALNQIGNYGMGGTYQVHADYHGPEKITNIPPTGDRIATLMTYLHAPRAGAMFAGMNAMCLF